MPKICAQYKYTKNFVANVGLGTRNAERAEKIMNGASTNMDDIINICNIFDIDICEFLLLPNGEHPKFCQTNTENTKNVDRKETAMCHQFAYDFLSTSNIKITESSVLLTHNLLSMLDAANSALQDQKEIIRHLTNEIEKSRNNKSLSIMDTEKKYHDMIFNGAEEEYAYCLSLYDYLEFDRKIEKDRGLQIDRVVFFHNNEKKLIAVIFVNFYIKEEEKPCFEYRRAGIIHVEFYNLDGAIIHDQLINYQTPMLPSNGITSADYESSPFIFTQPLSNISKIRVRVD